MKTKEVEIFVSDSGLKTLIEQRDGLVHTLEIKFFQVNRFTHKISLSVPFDQKITISESEFEKAWVSSDLGSEPGDFKRNLKTKLFGAQ